MSGRPRHHDRRHGARPAGAGDAAAAPPAPPPPAPLEVRVAQQLGVSRGAARRLVERGKVFVEGQRVLAPAARPEPGAAVEVRREAPTPSARAEERARLDPWRILHADAHVVVVDKPAGVATVPFEEGDENLVALVEAELRRTRHAPPRTRLRVVQRLDRGTSGVLVLARSVEAQRRLQAQFRVHSVGRTYWAVAHGAVEPGRYESRLVADRGDGLHGSTANPRLGKPSVTDVGVLERLRGATLVTCRPRTGRTHQIRIHLSEAGHPLAGETLYMKPHPDRGGRALVEHPIAAPRLMLHAAELTFDHPDDGARRVTFRSPAPGDLLQLVAALGGAWVGDPERHAPVVPVRAVRVKDLPRAGGRPEPGRGAGRPRPPRSAR